MSDMFRVAIEAQHRKDITADAIRFSAGNPRVEHITGALHLFRKHDDADGQDEGNDVSCIACVLAVPGDLGYSEFCHFLGSYVDKIREMRMVRREDVPTSVCMALLHFFEQADARAFVAGYNGRPFLAIQPDVICRVVAVSAVELHDGPATGEQRAIEAPAGHIELPTCPVCLERLDTHVSGVITTVCNHKFHNECLQQWGDSSCPVCRYCVSTPHMSSCDTCGAAGDLWFCLICGHVGCGRYKDAHARAHFEETNHCYSLEMENGRQALRVCCLTSKAYGCDHRAVCVCAAHARRNDAHMVWDYVRDSFVHRLIQSNADGKLIEVPSPEQHALQPARLSSRRNALARAGSGGGAPGFSKPPAEGKGQCEGAAALCSSSEDQRWADEDRHMMEAAHASKMDAIDRQYTELMTGQLESQRLYFETLRAQEATEAAKRAQGLEDAVSAHRARCQEAVCRAEKAEQQLKACKQRLADAEARDQQQKAELSTLAELNKGLIANQHEYKARLQRAQETSEAKEACVKDLQEQVRDLMVYLEASQLAAAQGSELQGGSAVAADVKAPRRQRRARH